MANLMKKFLIDRDFSFLLVSRFISQLGDTIFFPAVYWIALATKQGATQIGVLSVAMAIPPFLGAIVGVYVDRMKKKRLMVVCDFVSLLLCLALFANMNSVQNFLLLVIIVFLIELLGQLFNISSGSFLTSIVKQDDLLKANSLLNSTGNLTAIIGLTCGGILVATLGSPLLILSNGLSFLLSGVILCGIQEREQKANLQPRSDTELQENIWTKFRHEFVVGLKIAFSERIMAILLGSALFLNMASAAMNMLIALWVKEVLHLGSSVFGFILSGLLVGSLVGSFLINTAFLKKINSFRLVAIAVAINGVTLAILAVFPSLFSSIGLFFVQGIMMAFTGISFSTVVMKSVGQENIGKLFGIIQTVTRGGQPLGILIVTFLLGYISVDHIVLLIGGVTIVGGLYLYFAFAKQLRSNQYDSVQTM